MSQILTCACGTNIETSPKVHFRVLHLGYWDNRCTTASVRVVTGPHANCDLPTFIYRQCASKGLMRSDDTRTGTVGWYVCPWCNFTHPTSKKAGNCSEEANIMAMEFKTSPTFEEYIRGNQQIRWSMQGATKADATRLYWTGPLFTPPPFDADVATRLMGKLLTLGHADMAIRVGRALRGRPGSQVLTMRLATALPDLAAPAVALAVAQEAP